MEGRKGRVNILLAFEIEKKTSNCYANQGPSLGCGRRA